MIVELTTPQKMKFSIKDFLTKFDQIRSFLRISSYLLNKPLMEKFIFVQCTRFFWTAKKSGFGSISPVKPSRCIILFSL